MTTKEKATDLFIKYYERLPNDTYSDEGAKLEAKQCALIAVDEIIDAVDWHEFEVPNDVLHYYFEVKREIQKL